MTKKDATFVWIVKGHSLLPSDMWLIRSFVISKQKFQFQLAVNLKYLLQVIEANSHL